MTIEKFYQNLAGYWDAPDNNHMQEFQPEADCMDGVVAGVSKAWDAAHDYCKSKGMSQRDAEEFADELIGKVLREGEF